MGSQSFVFRKYYKKKKEGLKSKGVRREKKFYGLVEDVLFKINTFYHFLVFSQSTDQVETRD